MSTQADSNWQQVRSYIRAVPIDLLTILGSLFVLTTSVGLSPDSPLLTVVLGGLFLVFVPGYVLLAVIFPGNGPQAQTNGVPDFSSVRIEDGISHVERVALSFGVSVSLVPLFGLTIAALGAPLTPSTVTGTLSVFTVGCILGALFRRLRLPVEERFKLPLGQWASNTRTFLFGGSWSDSVVNVLLVICILVGFSAAAYAFSVPQPDAEFTSFALLTRTADGEYVSSDYPTNFTEGEPQELVVSVTNNRRETAEYTVVATLQRVRPTGDDQVRVLSQREQRRFEVELSPNETWRRPHDITPQRSGTNLRLVYFLYRGDAPSEADSDTADDRLQLWTNVSSRAPRNNTTVNQP